MKEIIDLIEFLQQYTQGVSNGINNFLKSYPVLVNQQLQTIANKKLQSSKQEYIDNTDVYYDKDYVLVVEVNKDSWLANAVESGASAFDIKTGLLNSDKAKLSSKMFKYIRVPMQKNLSWESGTAKGQEYQDHIKKALESPMFMLSNWKQQASGEVMEYQKLVTDDPLLSGFYRTRTYKSFEETKTKKPQWGYVMFRTVSERSDPNSWQHPGIEKKEILKDLERWMHQSVDILLENFIQSELDTLHWGN